jgi:hypothetical protein
LLACGQQAHRPSSNPLRTPGGSQSKQFAHRVPFKLYRIAPGLIVTSSSLKRTCTPPYRTNVRTNVLKITMAFSRSLCYHTSFHINILCLKSLENQHVVPKGLFLAIFASILSCGSFCKNPIAHKQSSCFTDEVPLSFNKF